MLLFEKGLCDLVRCVTGLKGRTHHGGKVHLQIMVHQPAGCHLFIVGRLQAGERGAWVLAKGCSTLRPTRRASYVQTQEGDSRHFPSTLARWWPPMTPVARQALWSKLTIRWDQAKGSQNAAIVAMMAASSASSSPDSARRSLSSTVMVARSSLARNTLFCRSQPGLPVPQEQLGLEARSYRSPGPASSP